MRAVARRKGEPGRGAINRNWPYQVALPADQCRGENFYTMLHFCLPLSVAPRSHSFARDNKWWCVYCFAVEADAEKFRQQFGGEKFDPKLLGRGPCWHLLKEPKPPPKRRG
jgi:hypothetical protein